MPFSWQDIIGLKSSRTIFVQHHWTCIFLTYAVTPWNSVIHYVIFNWKRRYQITWFVRNVSKTRLHINVPGHFKRYPLKWRNEIRFLIAVEFQMQRETMCISIIVFSSLDWRLKKIPATTKDAQVFSVLYKISGRY